MSILGNLNNLMENEPQNSKFEVPKVAKNDDTSSLNLKNCIMVISPAIHVLSISFLAVISFILLLLGINLFMFNPPQNKPQDIEFVLVDKEQMPINKNTKYRADRNSRASGKHDPKKKVSMPSQASKKAPTAASSTQQLVKKVAKQQAQQAKQVTKPVQKPVQQKAVQKPVQQTQTPKTTATPTVAPKPTMPTTKPSYAPPSTPKINTTQKAPIGLPAPPTINAGKSYSTGPVGGSGTKTGQTLNSATGAHSGTAGSAGSAGSTGSRAGSGSAGNAGPGGNPNGPWGVDALREPNFAPYMRELQSRIKYNWDPPKGNESKRVVLLFRIAKNGQLLSNKVSKSSGLAAADRAALNAVEVTAPFRPLPAEFKGQYIDIQFTFDYNVFGATGY